MIDFVAIMPAVAKKLWGEPNPRLSTKTELRWGTNGARCVNIAKGVWRDHERDIDGGVIALLEHYDIADPGRWLRENGFDREQPSTKQTRRIVVTYDYTDEFGRLIYQVVRHEPKDFRQRRPDGRNGWIWNLEGVQPLPYRLPAVHVAIAHEHPVFIVEGEKDVETLVRLNCDATCNSGGAGKWHAELSRHLTGADAVIIPDNDQAGRDHAELVARSLFGKALRVRVLTLPGLPAKGDCTDWFAAGGTIERFYELLDQAPDWRENDQSPVSAGANWATPFILRDAASLPARQFVYGHHLLRKVVSGTVAPGGTGKSALAVTDALAMATGRNLTGHNVGPQRRRVWYWNLEDTKEELDRRITAACQHFDIASAEIGGYLFVDSGRDRPCVLASHSFASGTQIDETMMQSIIDTIIENQIDAVMIDPFISSHHVPENDNGAIDVVVKAWAQIADRCNCSIELYAHTRKLGAEIVNTEAARGAKSFSDALRSVRCINGMSKDEAARLGIDNHRLFFRVYSDKLNFSPPLDQSEWYHLENIRLANGDNVGVVVPWQKPSPLDGFTVRDLVAVQKKIGSDQWRSYHTADKWAGKAVAEVLSLDLKKPADKARVTSCLNAWVKSGALKIDRRKDEDRHEREFIVVGEWADDVATP